MKFNKLYILLETAIKIMNIILMAYLKKNHPECHKYDEFFVLLCKLKI
jgi:hypothetical protein